MISDYLIQFAEYFFANSLAFWVLPIWIIGFLVRYLVNIFFSSKV